MVGGEWSLGGWCLEVMWTSREKKWAFVLGWLVPCRARIGDSGSCAGLGAGEVNC
jgi:hypothetical protein